MNLATAQANRAPDRSWARDDAHSGLVGAMMWVLIVLMIVPEGLDYQAMLTGVTAPTGGVVSRVLWLAVLAISLWIILRRRALAGLLVRTLNPFLLVLVVLALASLAWSIDAGMTARRLLRMATIALACVAFVLMGWHARRYQNVVRPIVTLMLLGSLAFGLAFPALAIHDQASAELAGAWRGLTNHKNGLGALACLGLILWVHAGLTREVKWLAAVTGSAIAAACLMLSRSSTSMATAVFVIAVMLLTLRSGRALRPYLPILIAVLVGLLMFYAFSLLGLIPGRSILTAPISVLSEKDSTLTGRTEIWWILAEHISLRPLLGSGYAAYWTGAPIPGTESYVFMTRMGAFYPGTAHNGYFDILNDLGWVGLLGLLAYAATHVRQSLRLMRSNWGQGALYLAPLLLQLVSNLSESRWFSVLSVDFVFMTLASTGLARSLLEVRLRAHFGEPGLAQGPVDPGVRRDDIQGRRTGSLSPVLGGEGWGEGAMPGTPEHGR